MTTPQAAARYTVSPPGFRLSPGLGLGRVRLAVSDLSRSVVFYEQVLGLRTLRRESGTAVLAAEGAPTPLVELHESPGARPVTHRARLGLYHFAVLLPTRAALGRFARHLDAVGVRAGMSDHLVSEALYLSDPDGLGIEVYADRPRNAWLVRGGELGMGVDPLDLEDLLRAGGETPWTGSPAGTRMGHVHLHVEDLAQAEAFYHSALGLDKLKLRLPGALFLSAGGYHHHLGLNTWAAGAPRPTESDTRLLEWTIELPAPADVEAAADSLSAAGYQVQREGDDALAADPWGTTLRLAAIR
jgi:catechol 2,3-dioxygenase